MIKRTPQEIADFFGGYVVQSKEGLWYMLNSKPKVEGNNWIGNGESSIRINEGLISVSVNHDWTHLYEPQNITPESGIINEKSDENCQKSGLCPHSGEVYTHKEYVLAEAKRVQELTKKVNVLLVHGWKPQGGIFVEYLSESDGYAESTEFYYQAMVRGL